MSFARFVLAAAVLAPASAARAQTPYVGAPVTHDFASYVGHGLAPGATDGALDSNAWFMTSSLGSCALGATCPIEPPESVPTGPFYGGLSSGGVTEPSLYAFDTGTPSGTALGVQIGSGPFVVTTVYRNDTGASLSALVVAYTFLERNDGAGQVRVTVALDPDGPGTLAPIALPALTDQSADAAVLPASFVGRAHMVIADLSGTPIEAGDRFDVIFTVARLSGSTGARDEIAIDDVVIAAAPMLGSCGDGAVQAGEQCDPGPLGADCCTSSCRFVAAGTACGGAPTVPCDAQDTCDGAGTCVPIWTRAGTVCRPAAGSCDVVELCTGVSSVCPVDRLQPTSRVCRAAAGPCDIAEHCTGSSPVCPSNDFFPDGVSCSNGLTCDGDESCRAGVCQSGPAPSCDDGDACTADLCADPGGCASTPVPGCCHDAADCDDGDVCTVDTCSGDGGRCGHAAITGCCVEDADCEDGNLCTADACDLGSRTCVALPVAGCCESDADCDDANPCTTDTCDAATGACGSRAIAGCCVTAGDCDDGDACTTDACVASTCVIHPIAGCAEPDAGQIDAGEVPDAGVGFDAGEAHDAGVGFDAGEAHDAGAGRDAGELSDGGELPDGGAGLDSGGLELDGGAADASAADAAPSGDGSVDADLADAGVAPTGAGCGCRAATGTGAGPLTLLPLLGLALARRRR